MAGTNAVAVKSALVSLLKTALAPVRVDDAYNGKLVEREYVYFGHVEGPHQPLVFRNGARLPRLEDLIGQLHVEVKKPAAQTTDTDARVVAIGTLIEETLANDPTLGGTVPGLMAVWMVHFQLTSFYMEDGAAASAGTYQIAIQSRLG